MEVGKGVRSYLHGMDHGLGLLGRRQVGGGGGAQLSGWDEARALLTEEHRSMQTVRV